MLVKPEEVALRVLVERAPVLKVEGDVEAAVGAAGLGGGAGVNAWLHSARGRFECFVGHFGPVMLSLLNGEKWSEGRLAENWPLLAGRFAGEEGADFVGAELVFADH